MADLVLNVLALTTSGSGALLLQLHVRQRDRLVPALLLRHALARLPRLVPALLSRLVPTLAKLVALLHQDGGALFLHHCIAELFKGGRTFSHRGRDANPLG